MTTLTVQRAQLHDVDAISDLQANSRRSAYSGIVADVVLQRLSGAEGRTEWTEFLGDQSEFRCWIARTTEEVIAGFILAGAAGATDRTGYGQVYRLHVATELRGGGIGRELLRIATTDLAHRHTSAVLWVIRGSLRTRHFYEREGWLADGATREDHWDGHMVPAVRYARPLR